MKHKYKKEIEKTGCDMVFVDWKPEMAWSDDQKDRHVTKISFGEYCPVYNVKLRAKRQILFVSHRGLTFKSMNSH